MDSNHWPLACRASALTNWANIPFWQLKTHYYLWYKLITYNKSMIVWVTWWWTWWHIIPIQSLIYYINQNIKFKSKIESIIWFGEVNWLEHRIYEEIKSSKESVFIKFIWTRSWKLRRSFARDDILKNVKDFFLTINWVISVYREIKNSKIDILFSKWGYVSLPVVICCWLQKIPVIIHESDIHAWLTSRISSYFAKKILLWFPHVIKWWINIWQILHPELQQEHKDKIPDQAQNNITHVLINWWSSGAKSIYEFMKLIEANPIKNMHFHIITWFKNQDHGLKANSFFTIYKFCNSKQMWHLYQVCDITITRWWVTSLFEQNLFWLKMIMLPLSITHDQELNCKYYENLWIQHITIIQENWRQKKVLQILRENHGFKKTNVNIEDINKKIIYWVDQVAVFLTQEVNL